MFEIVEGLIFDFIDFLGWYLPMLVVFGFIGDLLRTVKD